MSRPYQPTNLHGRWLACPCLQSGRRQTISYLVTSPGVLGPWFLKPSTVGPLWRDGMPRDWATLALAHR